MHMKATGKQIGVENAGVKNCRYAVESEARYLHVACLLENIAQNVFDHYFQRISAESI